jgi:tetratricopeptide (TPR) repeat protein
MRAHDGLWFDMDWPQNPDASSPWGHLPADARVRLHQTPPHDWLPVGAEDVSDELLDWAQAWREQFARARQARPRDAGASSPAAATPQARPGLAPSPLPQTQAAPEWRQLVLWRVESASPLDADEIGVGTERHEPWTRAFTALIDHAQEDGARVVDRDPWGVTLALGLSDGHNGQRWRALGLIGSTWRRLQQSQCPVSMAVVAGWALVHTTAQGVAVQGMRMRLVSSMALWAKEGCIACGPEWSELIEPCSPQLHPQVRFRDIPNPTDIWLVPLAELDKAQFPVGTGSLSARFVGRQQPLQLLKQLWASVGLERRPQGIRIQAAAGLGKTRLAAELAKWAAGLSSQVWWLGAQPELQDISWSALRQMLRRHVPANATASEFAQQMQAAGVPCSMPSVEVLLAFLQTGRLAQSAVDMLADLLAQWWGCTNPNRPEAVTLVVVDDVQWLDAASAALLSRVAGRQVPVLWVLTQRLPLPSQAAASEVLAPLNTQPPLDLTPLSDTDAQAILDSLPAAQHLGEAECRRRIAAARGIPLFLLTGAEANPAAQAPAVMEHCEALLNALGPHHAVLRLAALLGMRFAVLDLVRLAGEDPALRALRKASQAGLVVPRDEGHLAFFHPALREYLLATYARPSLQTDAARAAELFQQRADWAHAAQLWQQADRIPEALQAWLAAATAAMDHDDLESALTAYGMIQTLGGLPGEQGFKARAAQVRALLAKHGYANDKAHALADALVADIRACPLALDDDLKFEAIGFHYLRESGMSLARGADAGLQMVAQAHTAAARFIACWAMANAHFWVGDFAVAAPWFEQMVQQGQELPRSQRMRFFPSDPMVFGGLQRAWMFALLGDQALFQTSWQMAESFALGPGAGLQDQVIFYLLSTLLAEGQGDVQAAQRHCQQAAELARREGFELWAAFANLYEAVYAASNGRAVDLVSLGKDCDSVLQNYDAATPVALWLTARCLHRLHEPNWALATIDAALERMAADGGSVIMPDAWCLKSDLHAQLDQPEPARECLARASAYAQQRGWQGWLLRHGGAF